MLEGFDPSQKLLFGKHRAAAHLYREGIRLVMVIL